MKTILYLRVSSDKQLEQTLNKKTSRKKRPKLQRNKTSESGMKI